MSNIRDEHKRMLDWIIEAPDTVALVSCFVDGEPTAAICFIGEQEGGEFIIEPMFVAITDDMMLTDDEGNPATEWTFEAADDTEPTDENT